MGAESRNFHNELMARMGFEAEAKEIQSLFLSGRKDEAVLRCRLNLQTRFLSSALLSALRSDSRLEVIASNLTAD